MDDALTTADGLTLQLRTWPVERPHGSVLVVDRVAGGKPLITLKICGTPA